MKFKTNAKCGGCASAIRNALKSIAPADQWEFDLESPDRILTFTGTADVDPDEVVRLIKGAGFKAERL